MGAPYMQFYPADYLADTTHLTLEEHGAYLMLLMNYWQRGGALNNKDERLATVVRLSVDEWKRVQTSLREYFEVDNDMWYHARIERDLERAGNKSKGCKLAGEASGASRSNKSSQVEDEIEVNERTFNECSTNDLTNVQDFVQQTSNHLINNLNNKNNVRFYSPSESKPDYDPDFLTWYSAYPNKGNKQQAFTAWKKKKPDLNVCLLAVKEQQRWREDCAMSKTFTPNWKLAATWLNNRCWEDEVSGVSAKTSMIPEGMQQFYDSNGKFIG